MIINDIYIPIFTLDINRVFTMMNNISIFNNLFNFPIFSGDYLFLLLIWRYGLGGSKLFIKNKSQKSNNYENDNQSDWNSYGSSIILTCIVQRKNFRIHAWSVVKFNFRVRLHVRIISGISAIINGIRYNLNFLSLTSFWNSRIEVAWCNCLLQLFSEIC